MSSRMGDAVKLPFEILLLQVLGTSIVLAACGGDVRTPISDNGDAAAQAPSAKSCSEPLPLDSKVVFDATTHLLIGLGSDDTHPCSWPVPAPAANEDLSKRRLERLAPPETYWAPLGELVDAA